MLCKKKVILCCIVLYSYSHNSPIKNRLCKISGEEVESEWHMLLHRPIFDLVQSQQCRLYRGLTVIVIVDRQLV